MPSLTLKLLKKRNLVRFVLFCPSEKHQKLIFCRQLNSGHAGQASWGCKANTPDLDLVSLRGAGGVAKELTEESEDGSSPQRPPCEVALALEGLCECVV